MDVLAGELALGRRARGRRTGPLAVLAVVRTVGGGRADSGAWRLAPAPGRAVPRGRDLGSVPNLARAGGLRRHACARRAGPDAAPDRRRPAGGGTIGSGLCVVPVRGLADGRFSAAGPLSPGLADRPRRPGDPLFRTQRHFARCRRADAAPVHVALRAGVFRRCAEHGGARAQRQSGKSGSPCPGAGVAWQRGVSGASAAATRRAGAKSCRQRAAQLGSAAAPGLVRPAGRDPRWSGYASPPQAIPSPQPSSGRESSNHCSW
jgi:hypothetical protein